MQTPIEQIMEIVEMEANNRVEISMRVFYKMLKEKLPDEKQAIKDAYNQGYRDGERIGELADPSKDISEFDNAENHFNDTFKTE